eukprot:gene7001-7070_t
MIATWGVLISALLYLCALFALAHFGDTRGQKLVRGRGRTLIYALSLGVYCTSWTFFGSVGVASSSGLSFLLIYIGPILVFIFGQSLLERIVTLAKSQNITSIADFVAARYGKSEAVAALVALITLIGIVPYVALQLKAISLSLMAVISAIEDTGTANLPDVGIATVLVLAGFTIAFGTRRIDTTEHQDGLMLAIAAESVVKLLAFLAVGIFVTFGMFHGFGDLFKHALADPSITQIITKTPDPFTAITMIGVSAVGIILLPRQFHVTVVENHNLRDLRVAGWVFPIYLVVINIFVLPLAVAGLILFPFGTVDHDLTVLALPILANSGVFVLVALLGGISAATAMIVVACVALSIMVSNDLIMPLLLRAGLFKYRPHIQGHAQSADLGPIILAVRRIAILAILFMGYGYMRLIGQQSLSSIGTISFAAVAQIAPAFFGGLFWPRATARGAMAGLIAGALLWFYTMFLPSLDIPSLALDDFLKNGPLGISFLKPTALFGLSMPEVPHGVFWSLFANILAYIGFSLQRPVNDIEHVQARIFTGIEAEPLAQNFSLWHANITTRDLQGTVARYLGKARTDKAFDDFVAERRLDTNPQANADIHLLKFAETLLASAIGAASSRLVLTLLLRRRTVSKRAALQLLDDASTAIQNSRDLLQHALDHARQGITVFDADLRLVCWNREYLELFDLPSAMIHVGVSLDKIVEVNAARGLYGPGPMDENVATRLQALINQTEPFRLRLPNNIVIETRSAPLPDGGLVTTYTDVSESVAVADELEAANETLEKRVRERTEELTSLNQELARAKQEAESANLSKTRFLAAASHDILQPLNAARLYASSLVERKEKSNDEDLKLAQNVDASLEAVEEILSALLEISRLDAGAMKPEISHFRIDDILKQLELEFQPMAKEKGLRLTFVPCSLTVRSDRRLLRRMLQNLVSNAIKYTTKGRVLVGCRRLRKSVRIEVIDTGVGIPQASQKLVFKEFQRLQSSEKSASGLGLGLSIVERMSRVLDHRLNLRAGRTRGSVFSIDVPSMAALPRGTAAQPPAPKPVYQPLADLTILAIDNEPRILEGMKLLLEGWGCTVLTAETLKGAQQHFKTAARPPDVIIADYHLDEGDGLDAIVRLRWAFNSELPAVLVTADRTPEVRDLAASRNVQLLNKPVKPGSLRALLSQWAAQRPAAE